MGAYKVRLPPSLSVAAAAGRNALGLCMMQIRLNIIKI
jgi:hypothetical protein